MSSFKLILSLAVLFMIGCSETSTDTSTTPSAPDISVVSPDGSATPAAAPPAAKTPEPAQNADGVWHYTCAKGCAGGAGSAAPCATCGGTLAHNAAYHGNASAPVPTIGGDNSGSPVILPPPTAGNPSIAPTTAEPAQNAAGVWHYTCASGCAGGGGSATACGGCGGTLAHNAAYHQ